MVKQEPVSVGWQTVFMFIPYVWIYAFYRIEKLRLGIALLLIALIISTGVQMLWPYPYGFGIGLAVSIGLPIYFIRKWSREWNAELSTMSSEKMDTSEYVRKEDSSIELLKKRYAMGEISEEEFEKMKKDLE